VFQLPGSLNAAADIIRQQKLHVLIYPEISGDPVTYFLAFSKLAPVQMAWWGHPETSGIPAIDYFVSSDVKQFPSPPLLILLTETLFLLYFSFFLLSVIVCITYFDI
jgi:hypothetical protein